MKRKEFLIEFLGALGAEKIIWDREEYNLISGTVIYDLDDPEEVQDFCWRKNEQDVPSTNVLNLVKILNKFGLLDIDLISVSKEELLLKFNKSNNSNISKTELSGILEELLKIEVSMVDNGKETDIYFIHY